MRTRIVLSLAAVAVVASALVALPEGAQARGRAVDPLLLGKLPAPLRLTSLQGTSTYSWASGSDSTSEVFHATAGVSKRFTSGFPVFQLAGPIAGIANVVPTVTDCPWNYDGTDIGANVGMRFDPKGASKALVGITFGWDSTRHSNYVSSHLPCGGNAAAGATFTSSITNVPSPVRCDGTDACTVVNRSVLSRSSFSVHFVGGGPVSGEPGATIAIDYVLTFKRVR